MCICLFHCLSFCNRGNKTSSYMIEGSQKTCSADCPYWKTLMHKFNFVLLLTDTRRQLRCFLKKDVRNTHINNASFSLIDDVPLPEYNPLSSKWKLSKYPPHTHTDTHTHTPTHDHHCNVLSIPHCRAIQMGVHSSMITE